ncbi:hypothetical protein DNTS_004681 [Danionella cerebrum]|uniref:Uncharacterized protein n=1 Tax=Danionella cerebrum TaxID=2873325 RepID=A0A553QZ06_9TELE|nr:hypothetical protein DNTS_004681 [Danionella translucida]
MVLVHVGYLVLPVFGSVRSRVWGLIEHPAFFRALFPSIVSLTITRRCCALASACPASSCVCG